VDRLLSLPTRHSKLQRKTLGTSGLQAFNKLSFLLIGKDLQDV